MITRAAMMLEHGQYRASRHTCVVEALTEVALVVVKALTEVALSNLAGRVVHVLSLAASSHSTTGVILDLHLKRLNKQAAMKTTCKISIGWRRLRTWSIIPCPCPAMFA